MRFCIFKYTVRAILSLSFILFYNTAVSCRGESVIPVIIISTTRMIQNDIELMGNAIIVLVKEFVVNAKQSAMIATI